MNDEIIDHTIVPPTIEVVSINEQEDGSAIISFDMDIETVKLFAGIGLKKVLMDSIAETLKNES
jgi:predicted metal-dependent RNase